MSRTMTINCDLGEGLDKIDALVMPYLHQANIACGGHAGDPASMARTAKLAQQYSVQVGAHPSYPDRKNFGRLSLDLAPDALYASLQEQVRSLIAICKTLGIDVTYIKPHGALYNDANTHPSIRQTLYHLASEFQLPLMLQALPKLNEGPGLAEAETPNLRIIAEAFADRAYTREGLLVKRDQPHAVHSEIQVILAQVESLRLQRGVYADDGQWLALEAETLCVHSDTPNAVETVKAIKQALETF